jgi:uncharacterized Zn finger protein
MCKHVAAVLYGVGARLDHRPDLLFSLRRVDANDLVAQAGAGLPKTKKGPAAGKVLDDSALADVFGIEMAEPAPSPTTAKRSSKSAQPRVAKKASAKSATATAGKRLAVGRSEMAKKVPVKKLVTAKAPAKAWASSRKSPAKATVAKAKKTDTAKPPKLKAVSRRTKGG